MHQLLAWFTCLDRSTDTDYRAAKLAGYRSATRRATLPRLPQTKQSAWVGRPLPSTFQRSPAKIIPPPLPTPAAINNSQRQRGRPTRPSRNIHPFLLHSQRCRRRRVRQSLLPNVTPAVTRSPVSSAPPPPPRDCTLSLQFPWLGFSYLLSLVFFSLPLHFSFDFAIPSPPPQNNRTKQAHATRREKTRQDKTSLSV